MQTRQVPKTDCFAYDEEHKDCFALNQLYCKGEKCAFYKSHLRYVEKNGESYRQTLAKLEASSKGYKKFKGERGNC